MPKIIITILYSVGWKEIFDIVMPVAKRYADKYGYELEVVEFEKWDSDSGYNKLELIKDIFKHEDADIVFSIDCDCLLTNHNIKIEDFLQDGKDFYITKDVNSFNAGSFIIRRSEWSEKFIDFLLAQKGKRGMHCEQNAIEEYVRQFPNDEKICVLPHPSINSYHYYLYPQFENITSEQAGSWYEGNFVLHLPGLGLEQRIEILKNTKITE